MSQLLFRLFTPFNATSPAAAAAVLIGSDGDGFQSSVKACTETRLELRGLSLIEKLE